MTTHNHSDVFFSVEKAKLIEAELSKDQRKILRKISGTDLRYYSELNSGSEHVKKLLTLHEHTLPILIDLEDIGVSVNTLNDIRKPDFESTLFIEAMPVLKNGCMMII